MKRPPSLLGLDIASAEENNISESTRDVYSDIDEYENVAEYSDDDGLLRRAFYVEGELPPEAGPPQNGVDYLKHVKWEARRIPSTIVADMNPVNLCNEKMHHRLKYMSLIRNSCINTSCVDEAKPCPEWEMHFLKKFTELRRTVEEKRMGMRKSVKKKCIGFPKRDAHGEWLDFCLVEHPVPSYSILYSMDNVTIATVIDILAEKLGENNSSYNETVVHRWLFCLLAHLEVPLIAETSASLRKILKCCAKQRSSFTEEECRLKVEQVACLNIIIVICGKYFSQG